MTKQTKSRLFVVYTVDKSGMAALRERIRPDHIAFMRSLGDSALIGGPLLDADGETRNGGLYLLRADSLEEARAVAAQDPFFLANLFETASVREWIWQTNTIR